MSQLKHIFQSRLFGAIEMTAPLALGFRPKRIYNGRKFESNYTNEGSGLLEGP